MSYDTIETTLTASSVAVWLKENVGFSVTADFFEEFGGYKIEVDRDRSCPSCLDDGVIFTSDNECLLCGNTLTRTFVVTFRFSVNVKAASSDEAETLAGDAVSVDTGYGEVEDNYDLEVESVEEEYC